MPGPDFTDLKGVGPEIMLRVVVCSSTNVNAVMHMRHHQHAHPSSSIHGLCESEETSKHAFYGPE